MPFTFVYSVALTSMQRHDIALTLMRRCKNIMCPQGSFLHYAFLGRVMSNALGHNGLNEVSHA